MMMPSPMPPECGFIAISATALNSAINGSILAEPAACLVMMIALPRGFDLGVADRPGHERRAAVNQVAAGELALGRLDRVVQLPALRDADDDPGFGAGIDVALGELVDDGADARPDRRRSRPCSGSRPESRTCSTISATSITSSPTRLTIVRSPSASKSRSRAAMSLRRSSTASCAQAWPQCSHLRD